MQKQQSMKNENKQNKTDDKKKFGKISHEKKLKITRCVKNGHMCVSACEYARVWVCVFVELCIEFKVKRSVKIK